MPDPAPLPPQTPAQAALPPMYAAATWLFALLLIAVFALQSWHDWQQVNQQQTTEALRSTRYTAQIVQRTLQEQRRMLNLFIEVQRGAIDRLITQPQATAPFAAISQAMQQFFPTAFAFTLADKNGMPVIDDFDGLVGDICQQNIQHFAHAGSSQPVFHSPAPGGLPL
jgi:hypothetical protein